MTRLQRVLAWLVGWVLAVAAGEVVGVLLAAGLWIKSGTAADVALGGSVIAAFCLAPAAATGLLAQVQLVAGEYDRMWQHVNAALGRTADVEPPDVSGGP